MKNLTYAWRTLRHSPAFLLTAVATLGLGIGATTAVFSLFYQVLLRQLPVSDPEQLILLHRTALLPGGTSSDNFESVFSLPMYRSIRDNSGAVLHGVIARTGRGFTIQRNGQAENGQVEVVSGNFFQVLGIQPAFGRLVTPSDDTPHSNAVAVLSYAYWRAHYGSASPVGQSISLNQHSASVIGVAPPDFHGLLSGNSIDIFIPISEFLAANIDSRDYERASMHWLTVVARVRPHVSWQAAQNVLNPLFTSTLRDELPQFKTRSEHGRARIMSTHIEVRPASAALNELERSWRKPLIVLIAAASGLLLIACSNLASLLLARGAARHREIAIRRSIGATRWQIVSQLLVESLVLAVLGGALGIALAFAIARAVLGMLPADIAGGWVGAGMSWPILSFSVAVALASGLAFGMLPAWQVSGDQSAAVLKDMAHQVSGSSAHAHWRRALVVVQIGLSVVLLAGAGLFLESLGKLLTHNPGFRTEHLMVFNISPGRSGYSTSRALNLLLDIRERLSRQPGVTAVAYCQLAPYSHSDMSSNVSVEGYTARQDEDTDSELNVVSPGFFRTLGVPMLEGREFTDADSPSAPAAVIVNQAFVRRFVRGRDPIGLHMSRGSGVPLNITIIGVVPNVQLGSLREDPKPFYYQAYAQYGKPADRADEAVFLVRSRTDDPALSASARSIVAELDRNIPVSEISKMQVQIENSVYHDRALAVITTACGALALLLASLGLYGVIAYSVTRRTAEIGIRMALGADRGSIVSLVFREVFWMVAAGLVAGMFASVLSANAIASQLFAVQPLDIRVFAATIAVLLGVTVVATAAPVLHAIAIEPMQALRYN